MVSCSIFAPLGLGVRIAALGVSGVYMLLTALGGTCLGYRLMGVSTCPVDR